MTIGVSSIFAGHGVDNVKKKLNVDPTAAGAHIAAVKPDIGGMLSTGDVEGPKTS